MTTPYTFFTFTQRPDLIEATDQFTVQQWPEFMMHDTVANKYWWRMITRDFTDYQYGFLNESAEVVAVGSSIPLVWDGTIDGLPDSWDAALEQGFTDKEAGRAPTTLCALSITIDRNMRGTGFSKEMVQAMKDIGASFGLDALIAPVRPNMKSLYPLTPIERYIQWKREDGMLFDPWLRVHARLGATLLKIAPEAMVIPGTIAEWEDWTKMRFPESGKYIVPGGLVPVDIDCEANRGLYIEPNVWMCHPIEKA